MVNNKVILIGRMTRDAHVLEAKEEGQKAIAHFSLAVDKMRRKKEHADGEADSQAYFFRCTAFDRQAVFLEQYGKKGVKFAVEGHLVTGGYEKDGVHVPTVEVVVENMQFCEKKGADEEAQFEELTKEMADGLPFT